jgi:Flp pilus assembly protein TadG
MIPQLGNPPMAQLSDSSRRRSSRRGKGDRHLLCEAPEGPSRQKVPVTFSAARRGSVTVEAALMMPLILTLMLGVWEIGRAIELTSTLNAAAREGARMAAGGVNNGTPVTVAMVQTEVQNYLTAAGFPAAAVTGAQIQVVNESTDAWTDPGSALPLDRFAVTVTIPSGTPFKSLNWVTGTLTGINQLSATVEWLSANDAKVTLNTTLPF